MIVFFPSSASAVPKLTVVVDFPVPPFPDAIVYTLAVILKPPFLFIVTIMMMMLHIFIVLSAENGLWLQSSICDNKIR